jgi:hypothetical protein
MCEGYGDLISCRPGLEPGPIPRDLPFARCGRRPSHNEGRGVWVPARRPGRRTVVIGAAHRFQFSNTACPRLRILAARCARALLRFSPSETRGRREDRVRAAPAVSRAIVIRQKRTRAYRFSGGNPAFPAQWFYGLFRALPGDRALLTPSPAGSFASRELDAGVGASEPHVFTVRSSHARPSQLSRPPHPTARRDDRDPPLSSGETGGI